MSTTSIYKHSKKKYIKTQKNQLFIIYFLFWKLGDQYRISIALLLKWFTLLKYPVNDQDTAHGGHNCPIRSNSFIALL